MISEKTKAIYFRSRGLNMLIKLKRLTKFAHSRRGFDGARRQKLAGRTKFGLF